MDKELRTRLISFLMLDHQYLCRLIAHGEQHVELTDRDVQTLKKHKSELESLTKEILCNQEIRP